MKILKINSNLNKCSQNQNYSGFFSGDVPEQSQSYIGTSNVDISELSSKFPYAKNSVDLINSIDPNFLLNIGYIFDFSRSGVYGVYLPALDLAEKTKELAKRLEQIGYKISKDKNGSLTAYPVNEPKSEEDIEKEINALYTDIKSKGGSVFGVNVNGSLEEANMSFNSLSSIVDPQAKDELLKDLQILHVAATMVHEATHALGAESESEAELTEDTIFKYAQRFLSDKYSIPLENIMFKRGSSGSWYKTAQKFNSYFPLYGPTGSDLTGRFSHGGTDLSGQQNWGMLAHQYQNMPIEQMLGRQFMSKLPKDLSQENDILELQLRKYTRDDMRLDPKMVFEELLADGRTNDNAAYKTTEELLNDARPKPLMKPLKTASKIVKKATVFGWYNNLEISDGSTIPGLGDRVMAWDDRDESFSREEEWIKSQPRYNPEYDIKGFYFRWIEPRFQPQLYDDMTRDYSNTSPAKRFATNDDLDMVNRGQFATNDDLGLTVDILRKIRISLLKGKVNATRLMATEDMGPIISKMMDHERIGLEVFYVGREKGEDICSYWVYNDTINSENIELAERAIYDKKYDVANELMKEITGTQSTLGSSVDEVIVAMKELCKKNQIKGIYAIGSYAREKSFDVEYPEVEELDFSSENPSKNLKIGYLLSDKLGVKDVHFSPEHKILHFVYKGIKILFNGGKKEEEILKVMHEKRFDVSSCLLSDICNKDFTVNMKAYDFLSNEVHSVINDQEDSIKTLFDPDILLKLNPFIILRAIYLAVKHNLVIDEDLSRVMAKSAFLLFDGRYSDEKLSFAKNKILSEDAKEGARLLAKYGIKCL